MSLFFANARNPISSLTHLMAAILSVVATIMMLVAGLTATPVQGLTVLSVTIFGLSLMALYSASAYYHYIKTTPAREAFFRKIDHAMIYVLIAGTYTPICLYFMAPQHGVIFTTVIWLVALLGITVKIFWMNAPRWFSTSIYLLMGWAIIFDMKAFQGIPTACLTLIAAGGIAYSVGAVMYMFKKPNFSPQFGFHELFHLFIMLGSFLHFLAIFLYIL